MARVKSEFLAHYQARHGLPPRSWLFAELAALGRLARPVAPFINVLNRLTPVRWLLHQALGIEQRRRLPPFRSRPFSAWFRRHARSKALAGSQPVVLFVDTYLANHYPEIGRAAVRVLEAAGCAVSLVAGQGCCGRPMISKGLLDRAKARAARNVAVLAPWAERGVPILGLEPSCLLTLRDEYLDFFPGDGQALAVAGAARLVEEYLTEPGPGGARPVDRLRFKPPAQAWRLHTHCHAKSLAGSAAPLALLRATGAPVDEIAAGCCGMAGAFGYEREHYALSMQIGEMALLPAARAAAGAGVRLAAQGVSCRAQLADGAGVPAVHPIQMVAEALAA